MDEMVGMCVRNHHHGLQGIARLCDHLGELNGLAVQLDHIEKNGFALAAIKYAFDHAPIRWK